MRTRYLCGTALLLLAGGAAMGQQNAPAKAPAPKPAMGMADEIVNSWNETARKIIAMAEDWPEDKYDFKAQPRRTQFCRAGVTRGGRQLPVH